MRKPRKRWDVNECLMHLNAARSCHVKYDQLATVINKQIYLRAHWLVVARQAGVYPSLHMFLVNKRFFSELLIPCSVQHALRILRGLVTYSSQSLGCLPAFVCGPRCSCFQFSVLWLSVFVFILVSCAQRFLCLWIVHSWVFLRFSLTFIYSKNLTNFITLMT